MDAGASAQVQDHAALRAAPGLPPWSIKVFLAAAGTLLGLQLGLVFSGEVFEGSPVDSWELGYSDAVYLAVVGASGVAALARARLIPEERLGWGLIGAGLFAWVAGDAYAMVAGASLPAWPVDVLHFSFYGAALTGLLKLSRDQTMQGYANLDALVILLGLATLWSWLVLEHAIEAAGSAAEPLATTLAYPLFDLGLLLVMALVFAHNGWPRSGAWLMIGSAFALAAVSDSFAAVGEIQGTPFAEGALFDAVWAAGAMLLGAAALTAPGAGVAPGDRLGREFSFGVSVFFIALATLVLVADHFGGIAIPTMVLAALTLVTGTVRAVLSHERRVDVEEQLRSAALRGVQALAAAVDAKDPNTHNRSERVALYTAAIAVRIGLDVDRVERLVIAGKLHDVGKIGVPDEILFKQGPLTAGELEAVRHHAAEGGRIVAAAGLGEIAGWIRHHHERWDGRGYPDGLSGPEIPIESRILAVADALEAMTTHRPYRSAMEVGMAMSELGASAGTQFDPGIARVVVRLLRDGALKLEPTGATPTATYTMNDAANGHLGLAEYLRVQEALAGVEAPPVGERRAITVEAPGGTMATAAR